MDTVHGAVAAAFGAAIAKAFPDSSFVPIVTPCGNQKNGHYQCNNAMPIFKKIKQNEGAPKTPVEVAERIMEHFPEPSMIADSTIAKAGFISIFLSKEWISERVNDLLKNGVRPPPVDKPLKVMIDYSSPNIAKEMHVGHLRSTIIGDCIANILEFLGHEVHRVNHVGDWGTQFGMLIAHMKDEYPDFGSSSPDIQNLSAFYKAAKKRFDADPEFKSRAHSEVVKLQSHDDVNIAAWKMICEISRKEFEKIYDRLDIHGLKEMGESVYNPFIPDVVKDLMDRGIAQEDNGAKCIFLPKRSFPLIIQKSDGGFSYDSTDVTAVWYRLMELHMDWLIYITDLGQREHFEMIFQTAEKAGWYDQKEKRLDFVGFGVVLGEDKKKFKTRSGDTVRLTELLDEAVARSKEQLLTRLNVDEDDKESTGTRFEEHEVEEAAEIVGYGAVKYADLKSNRQTDYIFSFDRMLDTRGNTAVYLEYAHARMSSVSRKAGLDIEALKETAKVELELPSETELALQLLRFPDVITMTVNGLLPHRLCEYLYDIATKFSGFWRDCKVIGDPKQDSRLLLCDAAALILRTGLKLLGIKAVFKL